MLESSAIDAYRFRGLHPSLRVGTASDRYAAWIGQIYSDHYPVSTRTRTLAGRRFAEDTLPVESVAEYFEHFDVLELDFTFYRPLKDVHGEPTSNWFVLSKYAANLSDGAAVILKAPQMCTARTRRQGGAWANNPTYLNAGAYRTLFLDPAIALLGERLTGILFEQEYQRKSHSPPPAEYARQLESFFVELGAVPVPTHLEIRSPHLHGPELHAVAQAHELGIVLSHWTWLGSLRSQWRRAGERFYTASRREAVVRLLTPLKMKYAEAYALSHPFRSPVPELAESRQAQQMIADTTDLAFEAIRAGARLNILANNRAYGNAPDLARAVSHAIAARLGSGTG